METKRKIIDSAKTLFARDGFGAVSPKKIQQMAGVGQGSFYHFFKSKEELALVVIKEIAAEERKKTDLIFSSGKSPLSAIWDFLTSPRQSINGDPIGRFVMEPGLSEGPIKEVITEHFDYLIKVLTGAIESACADGSLTDSASPKELACAIVAVIQGGYVLAKGLDDNKQIDMSVAGVLALFEAVYKN